MGIFGKVALVGAGAIMGAAGMFIYGVRTVGLENAELKEKLEKSEKEVKKLDSIIRELVDDLQEQGYSVIDTEQSEIFEDIKNVDKKETEYSPEWPEDRREKMGDKKKHYEKMHKSKENHDKPDESAESEHPMDSDEDDSDDSEDDLDDMEMNIDPPINIEEEVYFIKENELRDVPDEYSVLYLTYKGYVDTIYEDESGEEYDYMQREYALGNLMEKDNFPEWIEDLDTVWIRNDKFHTLYEIECYLNDYDDGDD